MRFNYFILFMCAGSKQEISQLGLLEVFEHTSSQLSRKKTLGCMLYEPQKCRGTRKSTLFQCMQSVRNFHRNEWQT